MKWCVHGLLTSHSFLRSLGWHQFPEASCPLQSLPPSFPHVCGGSKTFFLDPFLSALGLDGVRPEDVSSS